MVGLAAYNPAATRGIARRRMYTLSGDMHILGPHIPSSGGGSVAVLMCHSPKKEYLRRLLLDPLPIESHLNLTLHDYMCADVVSNYHKFVC